MFPQNGFFLKIPVRLVPWPRKKSEWHASPLLQSQARSERDRERERGIERERERERKEREREGESENESEKERERAIERERERGANPSHSGHSKKRRQTLRNFFWGVIFQITKTNFTKINSRRIISENYAFGT